MKKRCPFIVTGVTLAIISLFVGCNHLGYRLAPDVCLTSVGLVTEADSSSTWHISGHGISKSVSTEYDMVSGKRLHCAASGRSMIYRLRDGKGHLQFLEVRKYGDGVAFRYVLGGGYETPVRLIGENTRLTFTTLKNRWLLRWSDSYEGFFPCNPQYEEGTHMAFPALFETTDDNFTLLTEADIERGHCASSYYTGRDSLSYTIAGDRKDTPVMNGYTSPWRVLVRGSLADVTESTLVTDLSAPCKYEDTSWIKPGVVSWVYWAYNHGSNDYDIVTKYVDMAVDLGLPYVLIDAEWDEMPEHSKGHQTIEDALAYARERGVKPMIWYNSSVGWVNGAPGPKYRLNDPELREKEFAWCESQGIAGVKIDFFSGDDEACMDYCIDLLESAARHHLLVNFHGATIPRGWMRTYPNLLSTEGVYGAEWYNNLPFLTDRAAAHNATLPFTRGVVGSMDYTPCTFSDSQHPHITTHAHELALTVLFESGLLHLADRPSSYLSQPEEVRKFFGSLPTVWDETVLIDGYPGHHAVMARRSGDKWYVAGINGTEEPISILLDNGRLGVMSSVLLFEDTGVPGAAMCPDPWRINTLPMLPREIRMEPRGGFVAVCETK